jgi:uncharacterized cupredoxin-like copper-binding protein
MRFLLTGIAVAAMAVLGACSGDDNASNTPTAKPSTTATAAATASASPVSSATGNTVNVTIQEWSINPEVNTTPAGTTTFKVKNIGPEEEHEFVVLKTDFTKADLPKLDDGSVDEEAAGITSPGEIEGISPNAETSAKFDLTPGKYLFICNLIDHGATGVQVHFKEGMVTAFTVQ